MRGGAPRPPLPRPSFIKPFSDESYSRYVEALSSLGLQIEDEAAYFFEGVPTSVETIQYGDVLSIDGHQSLSIVLTRMGGYRLLAVFCKMITDGG